MGVPKATLGYASRTAAVLGLRHDGLSTRQIATKLGIEPKTVYALESSGRRAANSDDRRGSKHDEKSSDLFTLETRRQLRPHALKRGISVDRLIGDIIALVAEENIVDAILDDAAVLS